MNMKTMYSYFLTSPHKDEPFLTSNDATWWSEYVTNHLNYDRFFVRMYSSFEYYGQTSIPDYFLTDELIEKAIDDFRADVSALLMMNAEKYRQLFRVLSVPDTENELFENVNGTTTTTTTYGKTTTRNNAERSDNHTTTRSAYTDITENRNEATEDNNVHKVAAFDSETFSNDNSDTISTGARKQTINNNYGNQNGTVTDTYGAFTNTDTDGGVDTVEEKRHGNIGVTTVSEMMKQHVAFWDSMKYMQKIFADIANELLIVG